MSRHANSSSHLELGPLIDCIQARDLKTVLAVAETGSFRKAAKAMQLGQSAVTRRVQKLEDSLGVSLFERRPNGTGLTQAGWSFTKRARGILTDIHAAFDSAHAAGVGVGVELRVGVIASLSSGALRDLLIDFIAKNPKVGIAFVEANRGELLTLLSHRLLDTVVASGDFDDIHGESIILVEEPIFIALHDTHELAQRDHLSWNDVREEHFIVSGTEPGPEIYEYLIRRLADWGRRPHVTRHRLGREGIMNLVGLGLGASLVADHWRGVSYPGVVFRPVGGTNERFRFSLVWRPENDNPALRRFVSLARVHARKILADDVVSRTPDPLP